MIPAVGGALSPRRRSYIDWARGIAVLLMIEAHVVDAWTRAADRESIAFRNARIAGGFAAPLFLWLAGVAMVLSASSHLRRSGSRRAALDAVCRRGLEILILGYLFRVQAFVLSPGGDPLMLFRVDILNIMGPALVAAALVWGFNRTTAGQVIWFGALATAIAMATPVVRGASTLDTLPVWLQWYLRPAGAQTTFVAFPWAGFVFAGAAVGALLAAVNESQERTLNICAGLIGAAVIALGFYTATLPPLYRESSFWTSSPTYFAVRTGIVMSAVALLFALQSAVRTSVAWMAPLARMGRSSLFVYWIHVELVYGYASWLWRGRLPIWAALAGWLAFSVLMYGAIVARDRIVTRWRAGGLGARSRRPADSVQATRGFV